jgi:hypothetical protein
MENQSGDRGAAGWRHGPSEGRILLEILTLVLAGVALWSAVATSHRADRLEARVALFEQPKPYPLGEQMGYLQRYVEKLYFAGQARNWELADFYAGEVGETEDDIMGARVVKDGVEVSKLMATVLPPAERAVEDAVRAKDAPAFQTRYEALVNACNACHLDAKHGFMKITIPERPSVTNQSFSP